MRQSSPECFKAPTFATCRDFSGGTHARTRKWMCKAEGVKALHGEPQVGGEGVDGAVGERVKNRIADCIRLAVDVEQLYRHACVRISKDADPSG